MKKQNVKEVAEGKKKKVDVGNLGRNMGILS